MLFTKCRHRDHYYDANRNLSAIDTPIGAHADDVYDEQNRLAQLTNKDAVNAIMS